MIGEVDKKVIETTIEVGKKVGKEIGNSLENITKETNALEKTTDFLETIDIDKKIGQNERYTGANESKKIEDIDIDEKVNNQNKETDKKIDNSKNLKDIDIEQRVLKDENGNPILDSEGRKQYLDDNDKVFRVGDELIKNCVYEVNGYVYKTDDKGRIVNVSGNLKTKNHEGNRDRKNKISEIGKGDQKPGDEKGHIIGDQFGGSNGIENLIPQCDKLNHGEYKKLEEQLAKEVKKGKDVKVDINLNYSENSHRPDSLSVTYSINGEKHIVVFKNGG